MSETPKPPEGAALDLLTGCNSAGLDPALMEAARAELRRLRSDREEFRNALERDNATIAALRSRVADLELMLRACAEGRAQIRPPGRGTHEPFIWIGSSHGERDGYPLRNLSLTDAARRALGGGG